LNPKHEPGVTTGVAANDANRPNDANQWNDANRGDRLLRATVERASE
jgi:hypothetical protein